MTFHIDSDGAPVRRPDIDAFIVRLVSRRAEAEYLAERLIEALDDADRDPDLEEDDPAGGDILDQPHDGGDDDEPLLGSFDHHVDQRVAWAPKNITLCASEPELDRSDFEPSLGAREINEFCRSVVFLDDRWQHIVTDQIEWTKGATDDREEVDEDGTEIDRGEDGDDNGIADWGGACEQWEPNVGGDLYV